MALQIMVETTTPNAQAFLVRGCEMPRKQKRLAVIDFETDPFKYGREPKPFACEFYSDERTEVFWGDKCASDLLSFLEGLRDPHYIYAHNGGKFDFHFLHENIDNPIKIINSRIVSAKLFKHTLRDSFAILPMPLKMFEKDEIDYSLMEADKREENKAEILAYLHTDCLSLHKLVAAFIERFGPKMTIGATAIKEIEARHPFARINPDEDSRYRQFYYGGRVECFKSGLLTDGPYKAYDVTSSYPDTMRNKRHPLNNQYEISSKLPDNFDMPYFVQFIGKNKGALPSYVPETDTLTFNKPEGEFFACSHELEVAFKYGLVEVDKVIEVHRALEWVTFDDFVDHFFAEKAAAKAIGDIITEIFSKFILNSGYGKFATNPDHFKDYYINRECSNEMDLLRKGYQQELELTHFDIWSKPALIKDSAYYDVGIAASITSGARATLLEGLQNAIDPIYCDTDSIICREFKGPISATELGHWKLEATSANMAVAGKKMYAMFDGPKTVMGIVKGKKKTVNPVKLASKGGTVTLEQMIEICQGKTITYQNQAPTFSLTRPTRFIRREFKMTA
jgi:hypothetical protein